MNCEIFEDVYQGNPDNLDAALRALEPERNKQPGQLGDSSMRNLAFDIISLASVSSGASLPIAFEVNLGGGLVVDGLGDRAYE